MASTRRLGYGTYGAYSARRGSGALAAALGNTALGKVAVSLVAVGTTAAVAGLGTYATFTDTTTPADLAVSSGTVVVEVGSETTANRIAVAATDVAPGDTVQRAFTLQNDGTINLASITLTTTATVSSQLNTDVTHGLQLSIDRCATGWAESQATAPITYTCPGGGAVTSVLASRAVVGTDLPLTNLSALTANTNDSLRATLTLPSTADNTFQNRSSTIRLVFSGTQRTATDK